MAGSAVMIRSVLSDLWPPYGLTIFTPRLELRLPQEEELAALAQLAGKGVHRAASARSTP